MMKTFILLLCLSYTITARKAQCSHELTVGDFKEKVENSDSNFRC